MDQPLQQHSDLRVPNENARRDSAGEPGAAELRDVQGASRGTAADELPMVVWLRGDEPYAEEFNLDAEATMEALGIKRSRLTQISGKELRVGRKRIDRYVRPVYRMEDVETYKGWTRATATHQRSSSVIKEAADELRAHTQELTESFLEAMEQHHQETNATVASIVDETYRLQREAQSAMQASNDQVANLIGQVAQELQTSWHGELQTLTESLAQVAATQEAMLIQQSGQQQTINDDLTAKMQVQSEAIESLRTQYNQLMDDFGHLVAATREQASVQMRFHRSMAEALAKSLEAQRETALKIDAVLRAGNLSNARLLKSVRPVLHRVRRTPLRRPRQQG